jgi:hypothetical protein
VAGPVRKVMTLEAAGKIGGAETLGGLSAPDSAVQLTHLDNGKLRTPHPKRRVAA